MCNCSDECTCYDDRWLKLNPEYDTLEDDGYHLTCSEVDDLIYLRMVEDMTRLPVGWTWKDVEIFQRTDCSNNGWKSRSFREWDINDYEEDYPITPLRSIGNYC